MPRPVRAAQEIELWIEAVKRLAGDEFSHRAEGERALAAARRFVSSLRVEAFEEYLLGLKPRLTDAQRALLMKRLVQR